MLTLMFFFVDIKSIFTKTPFFVIQPTLTVQINTLYDKLFSLKSKFVSGLLWEDKGVFGKLNYMYSKLKVTLNLKSLITICWSNKISVFFCI